MRHVINRPAVLQFLAAHHWVASTDQLNELGMSASALYRARRAGALVSPVPGVHVPAGVELSFVGRALAAQLCAGEEAFVSGVAAGVISGLRGMDMSRVEITIEERRRLVMPAWCRVVRTSWIDEDRDVIVRADGIRLASPLRMLFALAAQFNQHRFERAAEDVWHKQLVTPGQAADYLAAIRRSGRTGVRRMELWLEKVAVRPRPAQSGLELDVISLAERAGLPPPKRQYPVRLPSGEVIHFDMAWPDVRLAVEPGHSWWHGGDLAQRQDQARDRACGAIGWMVVRFDESVRDDLEAAGRELAAIYRQRSSESRSR